MPNIPYTGNITLSYGGPNTCSNGSPLQPATFNTANQNIVWSSNVPTGFPTQISQFSQYPNLFDLQYTLDINFIIYPPNQNPDPIIDVICMDQNQNAYPTFFTDAYPSQTITYNGVYQYYRNENSPFLNPSCLSPCSLQSCGSSSEQCSCCGKNNCYTYDVSAYKYCLFNGPPIQWLDKPFYPENIYAVAYYFCGSSGNCNNGGCHCHAYTGFDITLTLTITANLLCTMKNLENQFCLDYCNIPGNYANCVTDMNNYCFQPVGNPDQMPMGLYNGACQEFYPSYIGNNIYGGTRTDIDIGLTNYCKKYGTGSQGLNGLKNLFTNDVSSREQEICACHLNPAQYQAYRNSLLSAYPGFNQIEESAPCLVWQCASSPYKSTYTLDPCTTPQCVNVVSFNNDGSFSNSNVNINQSNTCTKLSGVAPSKSKSSKLIWFLIIIIILILVLIIMGYFARVLFK